MTKKEAIKEKIEQIVLNSITDMTLEELKDYAVDHDFYARMLRDLEKDTNAICALFPKTPDNPDGYEPQPDEGRLLTDEEIVNKIYKGLGDTCDAETLSIISEKIDETAKAQDTKTAPIAFEMGKEEAQIECHARVEGIFKEIKKRLNLMRSMTDDDALMAAISSIEAEIEALKKKEGVG